MGDALYSKDILQKFYGQVLRRHREAVGLSQEKLALECELDRTYISLLEGGLRNPSLRVMFIVAAHLNVSPVNMVREMEQALKQ